MAQSKKRLPTKRKQSPAKQIKAPSSSPAALPPPVVDVPPKNEFDARRQELMRERRIISDSLAKEVKSGFGDRSKKATERLGEIDKALKQVSADERGADPKERAYKLAVNIGAPVAGMVLGHKMANALSAKHTAAVQARNKELTKLSQKADRILAKPRVTPAQKNRLRAIVQSAEHLGLNKVKGPVGVATAGLLLAEGLYSRSVLAPQVDNEHAKEMLRGVGTASVFAATSLVGQRFIQNATQKTLPPGNALASINEAKIASEKVPRAGTKAHRMHVEAAKGGLASRSLKMISRGALRVATPAAVGLAAAAAFSSRAKAGDSTLSATGHAAAAAIDTLAMNVPTAANEALKKRGHGSVPAFISKTVLDAFGMGSKAAKPVATRSPPPLAAAVSGSGALRIASAGRQRAPSPMTTTKVKAHFKDVEGKGIFTRAHIRTIAR